jgi:hypothetical protein
MITEYWEQGLGKIRFVAQWKGKNEQDLGENIAVGVLGGRLSRRRPWRAETVA